MRQEILSPKSDFIFKLIFGDKNNVDILEDFLQSVLRIPPEEYEKITIIDPHLRKTSAADKLGVLDVRVQLKSGQEIDVDIQLCNERGMKKRIVYYLAKMLTAQMRKGKKYQRIRPVTAIVITDFNWIKDSAYYHNGYELRDKVSGSLFSKVISLHTLELPKARAMAKAGKAAEGKRPGDTGLENWLAFLNAQSEEEYMEAGKRNPKVKKAVAVLKRLSADEETRMQFEAREKQRRDEWGRLAFAKQEGRKEGKQEGRQEGIADVLALMEQGLTADQIKQRFKG